ncbi:MAG: sigma-54-dependent Fis family transcriptional regulator [Acidobacteria bacterium]|nr:sigma-54-dependent Fis family transcriptional regulator [Acidobacteriota bacterium]
MFRILVVDDDQETCRFMKELLARPDREIELAYDPDRALAIAGEMPFDLVISDINLNSRLTGLDVLRAFKSASPDAQVLLISGFGSLEMAVDAVRNGAFDFISKPFNIAEVKAVVDRALAQATAAAAATADRTAGTRPPREIQPAGLVGRSPAMLAVYKQIARAADTTAPVLIIGESGTGKELVARAVHTHSQRSSRPFVAINCGAITETLLESEMFGHVRGSFTGAINDSKGIFEQAHTGTVFLDELGETSPGLQVKLLRVLEENEVRPVGGSRTIKVDIRIIAATNVDIEKAVVDGRFRQDLYYRLGVITVTVPPLRERREDIPLLAAKFLRNACSRAQRTVEIGPTAMQALSLYDWPGNVRELENVVERLVVFSRGSMIEVADLPPNLRGGPQDVQHSLFQDLPSLDELEKRYLKHVLETVGGNRTRAAEVLGVDRRTLYRMAERFGISLEES